MEKIQWNIITQLEQDSLFKIQGTGHMHIAIGSDMEVALVPDI